MNDKPKIHDQPVITSKPGFRIIGIERYTDKGIPSIREAWEAYGKRMSEIPNRTSPEVAYGFEDYSRDFVMTPGQFPKYYYIASAEVTSLSSVPPGMTAKEVPPAHYAIFTYRGPLAGLPDYFAYIYSQWLPNSGYKMDPALSADFERYAGEVDPQNAVVEIHVPIVSKTA